MIKFILITFCMSLVYSLPISKFPPKFSNETKTFYNDQDKTFYTKFHQDSNQSCTMLTSEWIRQFRGFNDPHPNALYVTSKYALTPVSDARISKSIDESKIIEIYGRNQELVEDHVDLYCKQIKIQKNKPRDILETKVGEPEVRKIVDSGDQRNRIDVVFMGDGYTLAEKDKFFEDMERLTKDMFEGVTFKSYLPFFNIWAIFVESVDSGIGYNGPQNTPFELYREEGQLRVIWPGNTGYARTICTLTGTSGCDFPSIIANDDYYGGLGGEFVISTRSNRTGTFVLRHEMGHSFIDVGDEYDNSWAYSGVNNARSVPTLGWGHWLTGTQREERAIYRLKAYPWKDLMTGSETLTFTSDGTYSRWQMLVSVSAAGEADCLEFTLDGKILPWSSTGFDDREFYEWKGDVGFTSGTHEFIVRSKTNSTHPNIPRMICSVNLHEVGSEDEFHISNNYVSAYPTWSDTDVKTFRPTNSGCLMRNMTSNSLCSICKEGMWTQFFQKVALIDDVTVQRAGPQATTVTLKTLKVGPFRLPGNEIEGEELHVKWFLDGVEQEELRDQFEILSPQAGNWRVEAQFTSLEVRSDPSSLLNDAVNFVV